MTGILERLRHNHVLLMILCCLIPVIIVYAGISFLGWSNSLLIWSVLLLCPIVHVFMMKDHMKDTRTNEKHKINKSDKDDAV